jgi:hypothetical protein
LWGRCSNLWKVCDDPTTAPQWKRSQQIKRLVNMRNREAFVREFISWLNANAQVLSLVLTIVIAVIPAIWTFVRYLKLKSRELEHERFKIYHALIKELTQPDSPGQPMSMDRQIAIVYELRHFDEYGELTLRILEGLNEMWIDPRFKRLANEINFTIGALKRAHPKLAEGTKAPNQSVAT